MIFLSPEWIGSKYWIGSFSLLDESDRCTGNESVHQLHVTWWSGHWRSPKGIIGQGAEVVTGCCRTPAVPGPVSICCKTSDMGVWWFVWYGSTLPWDLMWKVISPLSFLPHLNCSLGNQDTMQHIPTLNVVYSVYNCCLIKITVQETRYISFKSVSKLVKLQQKEPKLNWRVFIS